MKPCSINNHLNIWRFPKIKVPPNHPFGEFGVSPFMGIRLGLGGLERRGLCGSAGHGLSGTDTLIYSTWDIVENVHVKPCQTMIRGVFFWLLQR